MIDVRRLRTDLDGVRAALGRRGIDTSDVDRAAAIDAELRDLAARRDDVRARVNALSKEVGALFKAGDQAGGKAKQEESRELGEVEQKLAGDASSLEHQLRDILLVLPNIPADEVPDGATEDENPIVRTGGPELSTYAEHQRTPHWEIGAELGILDLESGAKISGSMFALWRGAGATLVRALCQAAIDRNAGEYEEMRPPTLVRTDTMVATGHLPKFTDEAYAVERDGLWAIPTAEVPLTSIGRDEVVPEADLPRRFMAHTTCLRREAGAAGRDTRGLLRLHEFDKVELLTYSTPEQGPGCMFDILERAIGLISDLGLTWRVKEICTGDLGQSHARSFDVEVYAPGCDLWLEVSSCSWYSDYQARRANMRYKPAEGGGTQILHTCNGSALAVPRVWAALVEVGRQEDGSVVLPEVLHPYLRGLTRLTR